MTQEQQVAPEVGALISEYEKATSSSPRDNLTGLFNHGFCGYVLDFLLDNISEEANLTFAVVDIDGFGSYVDKSSFLEGDRTLQLVAKAISQTLRDEDIPTRLDSDRFAAIMPDTDGALAHIAAERIRSTVRDIGDSELSVSIGISTYPDDASTRKDLMSHAMEAVNHSKMRGKNRIYMYDSLIASAGDIRPHVLIVDDNVKNAKLLEAQLEILDVAVTKAVNGYEALEVVEKTDTDLVLLDVMMPGIDGYEVCKRIKNHPTTRQIPVVLVTALDDMDSRVKGIESGADDFLSKPVNPHEFIARTQSLIKSRQVNRNYASLESVLFSLANAVEAKDSYTQGHTERVSNLAVALGAKMGLAESEIAALRLGGILHDVGKIAIPSTILNKNGPLTEEEWKEMRSHPEFGYRICLPLSQSLGMALDVVRHHHEKLDGSSYPDGLKADEISLPARIMGVVDIYDALTSDRPYRDAMKSEKAMAILREEAAAGLIDSVVVESLAKMVRPESGTQRRAQDKEPGKKIVVIDDDLLNQKLVKALLELEGYVVTVAGSAEDGLEQISKIQPALVLMDIQLPGMNGLEATKKIKSDPELGSTPVIALSAYAMKQDIAAAQKAGCDDYVTKPVENSRLVSVIKKFTDQ